MKNQRHHSWQSLLMALPLVLASSQASLAQIDAPLSLGPPPCSMDNPQFNENVDANKCSTLDILNGIATLPAPNNTAVQPDIAVENSAEQNLPVKSSKKVETETPVAPTTTPLPPVPTPLATPEALPEVPTAQLPKTLSAVASPNSSDVSAPAPTPQMVSESTQASTQTLPKTVSQATTTGAEADHNDNLMMFLLILLGFASLCLIGLFLLPLSNFDDHSEE